MSTNYAMYYFVNTNLNMKTGKIASQCCHGMQYICENLKKQKPYVQQIYNSWRDEGCAKIILFATEEQMNELHELFSSEKVIDAGKTEVAPNSFTVLVLYPKLRDDSFNSYKIVK